MMKQKYGKPKFVLLSSLCFLLVMLLSILLMVSLSLRIMVQEKRLPTAVGQVELAKLPVNDKTMAEYVLDHFIQDERVTVENVQTVMEEGTFSAFLTELTERYNTYLTEGGEFPQLSEEDFVRLIEENADLIYTETGLEFLDPDKQKLRENLAPMVEEWNLTAARSLHKGVSGGAVKATISLWLPIVLGVLLLLLLVWMIVIHVRRAAPVGNACKTYGIAVLIPSVLLTALVVLSDVLVAVKLPVFGKADAVIFETSEVFVVGILAAAVLIGVGALCNLIAKKRQPAAVTASDEAAIPEQAQESEPEPETEPVPVPAAEEVPEPEPQRRFCRNCGKPLVNPDAKFCYQCGNVQEGAQKES